MGSDNILVKGSGEAREEGEERTSDWAEWGERKGRDDYEYVRKARNCG